MSAPRRITVTVADGHDAEEVAVRLRAAGMTVERVLGPIGIVTGTVPQDWAADRPGAPGLDGVQAVETDRGVATRPEPE